MQIQNLFKTPILIIIGKSASGKDTLQRKLMADFGCKPFISVTTRPAREGEQEGVDYFFRSKDDFFSLVGQGQIFEYRSYNTLVDGISDTWYYGSLKQELLPDTYYTAVVDINGAIDYVKAYGSKNCTIAYIECPDDIREKRAKKRSGFNKQEWDRRTEDDKEKFSEERLAELGKVLGRDEYFWIGNTGKSIEKAEVQVRRFMK